MPIEPLSMMAIGGALGGLSGKLFGGDDDFDWELIPSTPEQDQARKYLQNLMQGSDTPTREIAGMSDAEKQGMALLARFLNEPESAERQGALAFLTGLLDQPTDIMQLPEIRALLSTIENQTTDLVNSALRRTQISGMGTSGPQGAAAGREIAKGQTSMVAALAPYMSQMRSNQLTAANLINSLVSGQEGSALNKIGAATTAGSLPRTLEQERANAEYEKLLQDIQNRYGAAGALLSETRYMGDPGTASPNIFQDIIQGATSGLGLYNMYQQGQLNNTINKYLQGNTYKPSVYPVH